MSRHPLWCLAVAALLTMLAGFGMAGRLELKTDLAELLPRDSEAASVARRALADFGGFDFMFCVVEGRGEEGQALLTSTAPVIAAALEDRSYFREVSYRPRVERLDFADTAGRERLVALLAESEWKRLDSLTGLDKIRERMTAAKALMSAGLPHGAAVPVLDDPFGLDSILVDRTEILRGPLKVNLKGGYMVSEDGSMLLILLWPVAPSTDILFAGGVRRFLEDTRRGLLTRHPEWEGRVEISFLGPHIEAVLESEQIRRDARLTSVLAPLFVVLLFVAAFRRPEALAITVLPTGLGLLWTIGLTALTIGYLTQVTATFAAILVGLGVDFSLHIYNRFLEEVRTHGNPDEAVAKAIQTTAASTVAGALTTAIAFFSMTATSFVGFRELGILVGSGILLCLLSCFLMLPALLRSLGTIEARFATNRALPSFGLQRLRFLAVAYPRTTLLAGAALVAALALQARHIEFDEDVSNLRQPGISYTARSKRMEERFRTPSSQVIAIVQGATLEEALEENDRLYRNAISAMNSYPILAVDSLRTFFPSPRTQRLSLERMSNYPVEAIEDNIRRVAHDLSMRPDLFLASLEPLRRLRGIAAARIASPEPVVRFDDRQEPAFIELVQRYVYAAAPDRVRVATQIYPAEGTFEASLPPGFEESLGTGLAHRPEVTGVAVIAGELKRVVLRDLALMALLATGSLTVFLLVFFRSASRTALALFPVLVGVLCTLGLARLVGMPLNYLNILAIPIILGIGIDSGIHILHRYQEEDAREGLRSALERTGRAVVLSSLSTALGFASLLAAGFSGIRQIGAFMVLGVACTLFGAVVLMPALLRVVHERRVREAGGDGDVLG
jgi:predicted RND superfamily exporter protein